MTVTATLDERLSDAIADSLPGLSERLNSNPQAHLDLIRRVAEAQGSVDTLLRSSVSAARSAGHSWETIGGTLGMTRQAAQQRFGRPADQVMPSETHHLARLTALGDDEIDVLNRAGRYGWHSVGFNFLHHAVQRDAQQWEHRRVLSFDPARAGLTQQGWQQVGTLWFPWAYYARPTGEPALEGPEAGLEFFTAGR